MSNPTQDIKIQYLADILSLVAIVGKLDSGVMERVLASLGNELADINPPEPLDPELAAKLIAESAIQSREQSAANIARDFAFVAEAWKEVLAEHRPLDPYQLLPFAEIIFALVNHTGAALAARNAFERFGGDDLLVPMPQLSAALQTHAIPKPNLRWEMLGFVEPNDQALIGNDDKMTYLFKSASSGLTLRFSELELDSQNETRSEYELRVDKPLFAAFVAGLAGDLLYYSARLRNHADEGHEVWKRLQVLLSSDRSDA